MHAGGGVSDALFSGSKPGVRNLSSVAFGPEHRTKNPKPETLNAKPLNP